MNSDIRRTQVLNSPSHTQLLLVATGRFGSSNNDMSVKEISSEDKHFSSNDVSPLPINNGNWRGKIQKYCSITFLAIYALAYVTLSSNPQVVFVNSGYQYDQAITALSGTSIQYNATAGAENEASIDLPNQVEIRQQFISRLASKLAKVYQPVSPSIWCIDGRLKFEQAKQRPMGLCYLKIPRAASSTLVGINVRIARNFAARQDLPDTCIRHDGPTPGFNYRKRDPSLSFLWTFVRNPTARAMSRVASNIAKRPVGTNFHQPTKNHTDELSNHVLETLQTSTDIQFGTISEGRGGFQVQYTMQRIIEAYTAWNATEPTKVQEPYRIHRYIHGLLDKYDFIGVVERFDESLVALQLLLGLETSDILYASSRTHDQYTSKQLGGDRYLCYPSVDPQILRTAVVDNYLSSATWWAQNYGDFLLHEAASLSLDRTILKIGLDDFSQALKAFRSMLHIAGQTCHPIFPCSNNGTYQHRQAEADCYFDDIGCGYPCFDALQKSEST